MAGRGSRFASAGYSTPKPLIEFGGQPMIAWVIENIRPTCEHRFVFICQKEHLAQYPEVSKTLKALCPACVIIPIQHVTQGAACTVLLAKDFINNRDPLMIANSDQYVDCAMDEYLLRMELENASGLIMTFWADDPKWSFCRMDDSGKYVTEVVEKEVVSHEATVGIYNFRQGSDFVRAAKSMIKKELTVKGEYYVAPVYNELIAEGGQVLTYSAGKNGQGMYGLGVPEDLEYFKTTESFKKNCLNAEELSGFCRKDDAEYVRNFV